MTITATNDRSKLELCYLVGEKVEDGLVSDFWGMTTLFSVWSRRDETDPFFVLYWDIKSGIIHLTFKVPVPSHASYSCPINTWDPFVSFFFFFLFSLSLRSQPPMPNARNASVACAAALMPSTSTLAPRASSHRRSTVLHSSSSRPPPLSSATRCSLPHLLC